MSPVVPAFLFMVGCVLTACHQKGGQDDKLQEPAPTPTAPPPTTPTAAPPQRSVAPEPPPEPSKKRYVVAVLGDSITDAKSGGGGYLKVLREACPESQFINFGRGGDMINQMRRRFEQDIVPQIPTLKLDTLLVYGGVNDLYSDLTANRKNDKIEEDLTKIYQLAKAKGLAVVAVTVSPWGGFTKYWNPRRGTNTKLLNSWILGQVATGLVDRAVDSFAPLSCGNPDVLCPRYETRSHDGIHLGEKGHAVLGEKLVSAAFSDCL